MRIVELGALVKLASRATNAKWTLTSVVRTHVRMKEHVWMEWMSELVIVRQGMRVKIARSVLLSQTLRLLFANYFAEILKFFIGNLKISLPRKLKN